MLKKIFGLSFVVLLVSAQASAQQVDSRSFPFPVPNPLRASLTGQLDRNTNPNFKVETLQTVPGRENVPLFKGRSGVPFAYSLQRGPAPVVFVVPGTGGVASDASSQSVAEIFRRRGANVIVVSNPFSWQFALGASPSGLPGYFPRDSHDLYVFMKKVNAILVARGMRATRYGVVGYSMGGAMVPFLLKEDRLQNAFHFTRAISVNPPVNLDHAMNTIDGMERIGHQWSKDDRDKIMGSLMSVGLELQKTKADRSALLETINRFEISDEKLKWVIGSSFRSSLTDVIFVSQQVNDRGFLHSVATSNHRDARYSEAAKYDFAGYTRMILAPSVARQGSDPRGYRALVQTADMRSLGEFLKNDPAAYLLHNSDDFTFNEKTDLPWIQNTYGNRWTIFPYGGHCGNLWHPAVQQRLLQIFEL